MDMNKELASNINEWLKDPEYARGLSLLIQVCKNRILLHNLSRRNTPKNMAKITSELRKSVTKRPGAVQRTLVKKKSPSSPDGSTSNSPAKDPDKTYPETITRLIIIIGELNTERDKLHRSLREIPRDNTRENIEKRIPVIERIKDISDDLEVYYQIKNRFFTEKTIPANDDLILKKPPGRKPDAKKPDKVEKMSEADLIRRLAQLRSSLTKKKNKLLYQSVSKKKDKDLMPPGPQKEYLEQQINTDSLTIKKIKKRLDAINKAK